MLLYLQEYQRLMCLRFSLMNGVYFVLALFLMLTEIMYHSIEILCFLSIFYFATGKDSNDNHF